MRQASWDEMFAPRTEPLDLGPEVPREPQGWRRLLWWEDLLTFGLLSVVFLTVINAIDRVNWVDDMPSLYPIALFGLVMAAVMARLRWPEGFIHLLALPLGAAAVLGQILAVVPGPDPVARFQTLTTRMGDWFHAAFTGGISNDSLPFIVSVVALSWLAAYLSSWAIFRWQNAWLGLVPGGWALLVNISYLPGQFSFTFVVFLFGGALLVTRLHLMQRAKAWRERDTPYPAFLSLSVLHATFWLALLLLGLAWLLPQANEVGALESVWRRATAPVTERVEGLSRLFVSVSNKKDLLVHDFDDTLPFLGSIELPDALVLEVITEQLEQPHYLRADVYEIYTPTGWKQLPQEALALDADEITNVDEGLVLRAPITIQALSSGRLGDVILTIGPPRRIDRESSVRIGGDRTDVIAAEAAGRVKQGVVYQTVGSVSVAPEEALRAAGSNYPSWVLERYLGLPDDFPPRVRQLALDLTRGQPTPYDEAVAIESYLRDIDYDLAVPDTPVGEDAVEFFLFEAERGYFDYHASAMVVMLRSVGIPSRLVVGYVLQDPQRGAETDRYRVTERDAFAWPEVYFPDLGWVEFNPSPNLPSIVRPAAVQDGDPEANGEAGPDAAAGANELPPFELEPPGAPAGGASQTSAADNNRWLLIGIVAALAAGFASSAAALRYTWARGLAGLAPPARLWGQTVRLATWARLPLDSTRTPREYARSLREQVPGLDGVDLLADAYVRHRFGRWRPEGEEQARLDAAWQGVRSRLLRRLLRLR
jgi:hypothetical protein